MPPRKQSRGRTLRHLRLQQGLTIPQLAAKSGVSVGAISNAERDKGDIRVSTLQALCEALGHPNPLQL